MNHQERLERVAQALDEMSDEMPELLALSEELTDIAKFWPTEAPIRRDVPRWMAELQPALERAAQQIIYERYSHGAGSGYVAASPPVDYARYLLDPNSFVNITAGI